jgi:membrane protease YdiL (CAAX protease family)
MMVRQFWLSCLFALVIPFAGVGIGALILEWREIAHEDYSNVLINLTFLAACVGLVRLLRLSAADIGLKVIKRHLAWHVGVCLLLFFVYVLYYLFVVQISGLRVVSAKTWWGLLNYSVVAVTEEVYFRGICYAVIQKQYSDRMALFAVTLLFGFVHVRQGLGMIPRFFTGWLWGTVRYTSGMIFLLIFPVHFAYNVVWMLFEGNWNNPPVWAYGFPLVELALGLVIVGMNARRTRVQPMALS